MNMYETDNLMILMYFCSFTNAQLEKIAKNIVEIFPTESIKTFYVGPKSKAASRTNKSISSRGKLVYKYHNKLRQKRELAKTRETRETEVSQVESDFEGMLNYHS